MICIIAHYKVFEPLSKLRLALRLRHTVLESTIVLVLRFGP